MPAAARKRGRRCFRVCQACFVHLPTIAKCKVGTTACKQASLTSARKRSKVKACKRVAAPVLDKALDKAEEKAVVRAPDKAGRGDKAGRADEAKVRAKEARAALGVPVAPAGRAVPGRRKAVREDNKGRLDKVAGKAQVEAHLEAVRVPVPAAEAVVQAVARPAAAPGAPVVVVAAVVARSEEHTSELQSPC